MLREIEERGAGPVADFRPVDRARGSLYGLAVGDALGMPTQLLSRRQVTELYGCLEGFEPGPEINEISRGMPAGSVTDDTDQAVIVARALLDGDGMIEHTQLAAALSAWEQRMIEAGSLDLLGPSTRRALARFAQGDIESAGRDGDTNGAAMRIAPVGIATPLTPDGLLLARVVQASSLTHDTSVAIAGAVAVAAAVSAGLDGASTPDALQVGADASATASSCGHYVAAADVARRIRWALALVAGRDIGAALDDIYDLVGTGVATQEAVPAAFAIASLSPDDPWRACVLAAGLGGDTDTLAAMTGAIVGATTGTAGFPCSAIEQIIEANPELDLDEIAAELTELRLRSMSGRSRAISSNRETEAPREPF